METADEGCWRQLGEVVLDLAQAKDVVVVGTRILASLTIKFRVLYPQIASHQHSVGALGTLSLSLGNITDIPFHNERSSCLSIVELNHWL